MKKIILCAVLLLSLLLASCGSGAFNWDKRVDKLKDEGFQAVDEYNAEVDSSDHGISDSLNASIKFDGGDFTVECTRYVNLQKGDYKNSGAFMEFATEEQAQKYYDLYLKSRTPESQWKLRLLDRVVILTNSAEVMDVIGGEFQ